MIIHEQLESRLMLSVHYWADASGNYVNDLDDFVIQKQNWGTGTTWEEGDADEDGDVDLDYFAILTVHFVEGATDLDLAVRPTTMEPWHVYAAIDEPLFDNGVTVYDPEQGNLADCWFVASLIAISHADPEYISQTIDSLGDGTYLVRLYTVSTDQPEYYRLDNYLPTSNGSTVYADASDELWVGLVERAMANHHNHADDYAILSNSWPEIAFAALTRRPFESDWIWNLDLEDYVTDRLADGWALVMASKDEAHGPIPAEHVLAVLEADETGILFSDPNGWNIARTWAEVDEAFQLVFSLSL